MYMFVQCEGQVEDPFLKHNFHILCQIIISNDRIDISQPCPELVIESLGTSTRLGSAVGNVSDCRYLSDCRSRGPEFDPGPVPFFRGD